MVQTPGLTHQSNYLLHWEEKVSYRSAAYFFPAAQPPAAASSRQNGTTGVMGTQCFLHNQTSIKGTNKLATIKSIVAATTKRSQTKSKPLFFGDVCLMCDAAWNNRGHGVSSSTQAATKSNNTFSCRFGSQVAKRNNNL